MSCSGGCQEAAGRDALCRSRPSETPQPYDTPDRYIMPRVWSQPPSGQLTTMSHTCHHCKKIGHLARVCPGPPSSSDPLQNPPPSPTRSTGCLHMATVKLSPSLKFEPAPTINAHMSSLNGQATVQAQTNSGVDICVAGTALLQQLHE